MPQNRIQFQPGMSLNAFIEQYGTEAQCEQALERARWPQGFVCPQCGAREHSRFLADGRAYWQCATCRTQHTVTSGTLFHASKLPLTTWFQAIYLVTQNKNSISALSLKRHLGVAYTTAWRVKHKLLEAMRQRESHRLLDGGGVRGRRRARRRASRQTGARVGKQGAVHGRGRTRRRLLRTRDMNPPHARDR